MGNNIDWNLASKAMVMAISISVILLFLGIVVLVFIHVCLASRTFSYGGGDSMIEIERSGNNGTTNMSREVEKLPCYDYLAKSSKGISPSDHQNCSVCLDKFKKGDKCRLLPICNHSFLAHCVDAWLLVNPNCPICRTTADSRRFGEEISGRVSDIDMEGQNRTDLALVTDHDQLGPN